MASAALTDQDGLPLNSGASTTRFGVGLPGGARCAGDTAHDGYHVSSFLVPGGSGLGDVTFAPLPSRGYGLVEHGGAVYIADTQAGSGKISPLPRDFEWAALLGTNGTDPTVATLLANGTDGAWDGGVVCVDATGHATRAWTFHIVFTASATDQNGFVWAVVPDVPEQLPEAPFALAFPVAAVTVVGIATVLRRRGRRRHAPQDQPT
jgi:hypothetical protein